MSSLLSELARTGDVAGAESAVREMLRTKSCTVHRTTLNLLIKACARGADGQAAEYWFREMTPLGLQPNRASYCNVVLAWVRNGDLTRAEAWIKASSQVGYKLPPGFCWHVARRFMKVDEPSPITDDDGRRGPPISSSAACAASATRWLLHAHSIGVSIDRATINLLMAALARNGDLRRTEQWAKFMQENDITPNRSTMCALVTASLRVEDGERAQRWLGQMRAFGFEPGQLDNWEQDQALGKDDDFDEEGCQQQSGRKRAISTEGANPDRAAVPSSPGVKYVGAALQGVAHMGLASEKGAATQRTLPKIIQDFGVPGQMWHASHVLVQPQAGCSVVHL